MPSVEELTQKYQDYPDRRLVEILRYSKDYISEAVEAAQLVLDQRSIQQGEIDKIVEELADKEHEKRKQSNKPLSRGEKMLFMFVPLAGLIFLLMAMTDAQSKGQSKRISEMFLFSGIGLLLFFILMWILNG